MLVQVLRNVLEQPTSSLLAGRKDQPPIRRNGSFESIKELLGLLSVGCSKQVPIIVEVERMFSVFPTEISLPTTVPSSVARLWPWLMTRRTLTPPSQAGNEFSQ